ncbi:hypothetical protein ACJX0J_018669, partial [Zea mays]
HKHVEKFVRLFLDDDRLNMTSDRANIHTNLREEITRFCTSVDKKSLNQRIYYHLYEYGHKNMDEYYIKSNERSLFVHFRMEEVMEEAYNIENIEKGPRTENRASAAAAAAAETGVAAETMTLPGYAVLGQQELDLYSLTLLHHLVDCLDFAAAGPVASSVYVYLVHFVQDIAAYVIMDAHKPAVAVDLTGLFLGYEEGVCFHTCVIVVASDVVGTAGQMPQKAQMEILNLSITFLAQTKLTN